MNKEKIKLPIIVLFVFVLSSTLIINAENRFVHPGGLHTHADLDRMKTQVAEGAHPWIDGWNLLIKDPLAQNTYKASPKENMNIRQVMSTDAHAAYLNAIRWYVSGDESYAKCAIGIFNDYSSVVNQIPSGGNTDIVGLGGIGISELAMAAEIMRIYEGWNPADFDRFKNMMVNYFYPVCHDFLVNHNGAYIDYYWANWDANNITALIAIGVLCDNQAIGKVFLSWQPSADYTATGYVIQRSTQNNGDYSTIASWDDNTYTVYTDNSVSNGTTYFYRVAALNRSGTGEFSSVSGSTPLDATVLPSKWEMVNIGGKLTGRAEFADAAGSTFIVTGNGAQIGGTEDNATYCYTKVTGDYEITCRISDITGSSLKSGLMIRESLNPNSTAVTMTLGEGGGRFARMGYRISTGAGMSSTLGNTYTWLPAWFRLKRTGNTFTVFESSDGEKWFEVDRVEISMASSCFAGLALCARKNGSDNTTTFDHVTIINVNE